MAIKKTELYSSLWASCDELRGGMDASQYKDYVRTMLFMKFVSDKYKGAPYGMIGGPQGASFDDMDAEIQALEQRLGKTRQIKQDMTQELLTGKKRLVQPLNKESQHGCPTAKL
ncbi:MAG: type I restriction-modification system subunit M N-terminal domain-containing protein [Enterovibrio sp.]